MLFALKKVSQKRREFAIIWDDQGGAGRDEAVALPGVDSGSGRFVTRNANSSSSYLGYILDFNIPIAKSQKELSTERVLL
jgi:hypothetical protein